MRGERSSSSISDHSPGALLAPARLPRGFLIRFNFRFNIRFNIRFNYGIVGGEEFSTKFRVAVLTNGFSAAAHQVLIEVDIVYGAEHCRQDLVCGEQVVRYARAKPDLQVVHSHEMSIGYASRR